MTLIGSVFVCLTCVRCAGGGAPGGPTSPPVTNLPPGTDPPPVDPPATTEVFVGAGDIGWCGLPGAAATGRLLDGIGGSVFTAGDNAYLQGTAQQFRDCYDPFWGRHKGRTFPSPGNHDYDSPGAVGYFEYFGAQAGTPGVGYYVVPLALTSAWHVVSLNSNFDYGVGVSQNSPQGQWLKADLAANRKKCTLVYWHYPLFTSGPNGDQAPMRDFWRILYDAGVDVVVNGHDHLYERFARQDPEGHFDPTRGIREFIVGTGGAMLYSRVTNRANSEVLISNYGVLKFTLEPASYQWDFIPVSGPGDHGSDSCHTSNSSSANPQSRGGARDRVGPRVFAPAPTRPATRD
jgi:hypothetical protein